MFSDITIRFLKIILRASRPLLRFFRIFLLILIILVFLQTMDSIARHIPRHKILKKGKPHYLDFPLTTQKSLLIQRPAHVCSAFPLVTVVIRHNTLPCSNIKFDILIIWHVNFQKYFVCFLSILGNSSREVTQNMKSNYYGLITNHIFESISCQ